MLRGHQHHARRVGEILRILGKYGLADWLSPLDYDWLDHHLISAEGKTLHGLPRARRIRLALTELGTSFIKIGQIMSTRPDLVGTELAAELSQLQASTPADDFSQVVTTIEEEFGQGPDTLFARFDPTPIASASIAQVHTAVLESGERVVVKVMRRSIEDMVSRDLEIFVRFAALAERHVTRLAQYQPAATARYFQRTVLRELNFSYELRHLEQFTRNFIGDDQVNFPKPYHKLSSRRVLTMELLDGVPVSDVDRLLGEALKRDGFARRAAAV